MRCSDVTELCIKLRSHHVGGILNVNKKSVNVIPYSMSLNADNAVRISICRL